MAQALNLARSAMAPLMRATVMMAKVALNPALMQIRRAHEVLQAEVGEGVAEQAEDAVTGGHGVAPQDPHDANDAGRDEAHHDHVERGLGAGHAAVEEAEARGHEQHHCRRQHQPDVFRRDLHLRVPSHQVFRTGPRVIPGHAPGQYFTLRVSDNGALSCGKVTGTGLA